MNEIIITKNSTTTKTLIDNGQIPLSFAKKNRCVPRCCRKFIKKALIDNGPSPLSYILTTSHFARCCFSHFDRCVIFDSTTLYFRCLYISLLCCFLIYLFFNNNIKYDSLIKMITNFSSGQYFVQKIVSNKNIRKMKLFCF